MFNFFFQLPKPQTSVEIECLGIQLIGQPTGDDVCAITIHPGLQIEFTCESDTLGAQIFQNAQNTGFTCEMCEESDTSATILYFISQHAIISTSDLGNTRWENENGVWVSYDF